MSGFGVRDLRLSLGGGNERGGDGIGMSTKTSRKERDVSGGDGIWVMALRVKGLGLAIFRWRCFEDGTLKKFVHPIKP